MAAAANETGLQSSTGDERSDRKISLHPLAIVAVSDHSMAISAGASTKAPGSKVLGVLWGKQKGLEVAITDAVELAYEFNEAGQPVVSAEAINEQKSLYTEVYKNYEMLGWYSVGTEIQEVDMAIHREMMKFNESPFFMLMSPDPDPDAKDLPVSLYESELHMANDEMKMIFAPCSFQLETSQAERITMEEVAKGNSGGEGSNFEAQNVELTGSLRSLMLRVRSLVAFLNAVKAGQVPMDQKLLRQVADICNQLPPVDTNELQGALISEYNDALIINNLAAVTKATAAISELSDKMTKLSPSMPVRF